MQGAPAPAELAWLRAVDAYTVGAYPQAEEEFRAAVRLDPTMADAWLGLHALRADTATALLRMHRHRDRFGEQRVRHRRTLNSWYWLGWWVQPVLETGRDLLLAHASHWLDGRQVAELDQALAGCPPVDGDPQVRFLHACRAYLVKDWDQLVRHTEPLVDDPALGIEAGLFGGMARVRLEMYGQAEPLLSAALMRCRSEQPQRKELRYWLARAHEGTGRSAAALPLYRAVHRIDPSFMDTSARLAAIAASDGFEEGPDLAAVTAPGLGQEAGTDLDPLAPLDPLDGRDLLTTGEADGVDGDLAGVGGGRPAAAPPPGSRPRRPARAVSGGRPPGPPIRSCWSGRWRSWSGWSVWSRSSVRYGRCRRSCGWRGYGPARGCRCSRPSGTSSSPAPRAPARRPWPGYSGGSSTRWACSAATISWRPNAPIWWASSSARPPSRPMS